MLFRLEIENFYSILDRQVIDLRVSAKVPDETNRFGQIYPNANERAAKVVAFFGANAAGKTTVLRALSFIAWFIRDSFQLPPENPLPFALFQSSDFGMRPTRLAVSLGGASNLAQPDDPDTSFGTYQYEVRIAHRKGQPSVIASELLTHRPHGARKPSRVFERNQDGQVTGSRSFALTGLGTIAEKIRWNASVIATLAQFDDAPAVTIRKVAKLVYSNILIYKQDYSDTQIVQTFANNQKLLEALNREIPRVDFGAREMQILSGANGQYLQFQHDGLNLAVPWVLESHGTQSFVRSFPILWPALQSGGVAIVDELDASLHPLMLPEIARWFYDPKRNPDNAQLWITCQNAAFLEELKKEEIYFCEKDNSGRTHVHGLQDVQSVRRIDNYYRKYLSGAYGAIPNIG